MNITTQLNRVILLALPLALGACSFTLPNTKPFADTATALEDAGKTSFQTLNNSFSVINNAWRDRQCAPSQNTSKDRQVRASLLDDYKTQLQALNEIEAVHIAAFQAVGTYANALDGIVQSTNAENAKIKNLQTTLDGAFAKIGENASKLGPYGPPTAAGAELLKAVNALVAKIRLDINNWQALNKLSEAVSKAGGALDEFNAAMNESLTKYNDLAKTKPMAFKAAFRDCHQVEYDYYRALQQARIKTAQDISVLGFSDAGANREAQTAGGVFGGKQASVMNSIIQQLQFEKPYYDTLMTQETAVASQLESIPIVFAKGRETLRQLAAAHKDLALQIDKGAKFDFNVLKSYASDLQATVNDVKKVQSALPQ